MKTFKSLRCLTPTFQSPSMVTPVVPACTWRESSVVCWMPRCQKKRETLVRTFCLYVLPRRLTPVDFHDLLLFTLPVAVFLGLALVVLFLPLGKTNLQFDPAGLVMHV